MLKLMVLIKDHNKSQLYQYKVYYDFLQHKIHVHNIKQFKWD